MPLLKKPVVSPAVAVEGLKIETVSCAALKLWAKNPRKNDEAAPKLAELLKIHGQRSPIVVWRKNMTVYKGNTTLKAARLLGWKTIQVVLADFPSEAAATAYGIADNKSSEFAEWDDTVLRELLKVEKLQEKDIGFTKIEFKDLFSLEVSIEKLDIKKLLILFSEFCLSVGVILEKAFIFFTGKKFVISYYDAIIQFNSLLESRKVSGFIDPKRLTVTDLQDSFIESEQLQEKRFPISPIISINVKEKIFIQLKQEISSYIDLSLPYEVSGVYFLAENKKCVLTNNKTLITIPVNCNSNFYLPGRYIKLMLKLNELNFEIFLSQCNKFLIGIDKINKIEVFIPIDRKLFLPEEIKNLINKEDSLQFENFNSNLFIDGIEYLKKFTDNNLKIEGKFLGIPDRKIEIFQRGFFDFYFLLSDVETLKFSRDMNYQIAQWEKSLLVFKEIETGALQYLRSTKPEKAWLLNIGKTILLDIPIIEEKILQREINWQEFFLRIKGRDSKLIENFINKLFRKEN